MLDTTLMIQVACDGDKLPTYARYVMTLKDCIEEYAESEKPALAEADFSKNTLR